MVAVTVIAVIVAAEARRRYRLRIALTAEPELTTRINEGENTRFRMKLAQGLRVITEFACPTLVVYAAQALNCLELDSTLVLWQDPQTVCITLAISRLFLCEISTLRYILTVHCTGVLQW